MSDLVMCAICRTVAGMRCPECLAPMCDDVCREACIKEHRAAHAPKIRSSWGHMGRRKVVAST